MNPGELRQRIDLLTLNGSDGVYEWDVLDSIWAKAEDMEKANLFSKVGIGAKSARFTIRRRPLTLHQAFRWQGKHYFLTDIKEIDRMYYEVIAAQIEPRSCIATRRPTIKNELNRPISGAPTVISFPGCLTERYMGYRQEKPQAVNETSYILVTPKVINLQIADLVKIGEDTYNVQIIHDLDEYKNEYEIAADKEA